MNEILDFYQQQAKAHSSSIPWLAQLQSKALGELNYWGFPTRRHEEWKYTVVDSLLKQGFIQSQNKTPVDAAELTHIPVQRQLINLNGSIAETEWLRHVPDGVIVMPLAQAIIERAELVQTCLNKILHSEHGFHSLNTAMLQSGVLIYIPQGVRIAEPIALRHRQNQMNQAVYLRHLIVAEADSEATIIEDYEGEGTYFTNTISEISLSARARLTHYKIQRESKLAYHLGHVAVKQAAHSHYANHSLNLGAKLARSDLSIDLDEAHAHCLMNGIYAPSEGQHVDHHTTVHHRVADCSSEQDYKGILTGRSRAVFNGKVIVAKDAQHTEAKQQNKNLLLSDKAEVDTKPQLEIFANDVICTHGATVGQLDEEALFYLATRGIGRLEAAHYLIHAFAEDNLRLIPHHFLAEWMGTLLTQQVE